MASASPSPIEHLKTLLTEEVLNTVQSYFEIKIVHEEGGTLYLFLHDRVHELFHYYAKTQCCWVPTNPCSKVQIKGKLKKEQFEILFEYDPLVQPTHETKDIKGRILQHCICPLAPRQSKDLDVTDLDFTLINCLIKTCRKTPAGHPQWLRDILEVRNELSHLGDTNDITADRVEAWWEKLENAAINIAGTIGAAHKKGLERRISKIKTSQSQLEELMEALKCRDDQLEQKILIAIKNMGINIDGVHFRITTAKDEPKICPDIAVPTSCTDPKKCTVGWKFYGPADWSISEMQKKLECIGIIGDFKIQFVHQGCLMVHTTIDRPILSDADVFREAVEEFLLLFTKRLKIPVTRKGHPLDVVLCVRDHNAHNTAYGKTEDSQKSNIQEHSSVPDKAETRTETTPKFKGKSGQSSESGSSSRSDSPDEWKPPSELASTPESAEGGSHPRKTHESVDGKTHEKKASTLESAEGGSTPRETPESVEGKTHGELPSAETEQHHDEEAFASESGQDQPHGQLDSTPERSKSALSKLTDIESTKSQGVLVQEDSSVSCSGEETKQKEGLKTTSVSHDKVEEAALTEEQQSEKLTTNQANQSKTQPIEGSTSEGQSTKNDVVGKTDKTESGEVVNQSKDRLTGTGGAKAKQIEELKRENSENEENLGSDVDVEPKRESPTPMEVDPPVPSHDLEGSDNAQENTTSQLTFGGAKTGVIKPDPVAMSAAIFQHLQGRANDQKEEKSDLNGNSGKNDFGQDYTSEYTTKPIGHVKSFTQKNEQVTSGDKHEGRLESGDKKNIERGTSQSSADVSDNENDDDESSSGGEDEGQKDDTGAGTQESGKKGKKRRSKGATKIKREKKKERKEKKNLQKKAESSDPIEEIPNKQKEKNSNTGTEAKADQILNKDKKKDEGRAEEENQPKGYNTRGAAKNKDNQEKNGNSAYSSNKKDGKPEASKGSENKESAKAKVTKRTEFADVHFHILVSPLLLANKNNGDVHIHFQSSTLDGWNSRKHKLIFKRQLEEGYLSYDGLVRIPKELLHGILFYSYYVVKDGKDVIDEYVYCHSTEANNRTLNIKRAEIRDTIHQFDGALKAKPEKNKGFMKAIKGHVKEFFGVDEYKNELANEASLSFQSMAPEISLNIGATNITAGEELVYQFDRLMDGLQTTYQVTAGLWYSGRAFAAYLTKDIHEYIAKQITRITEKRKTKNVEDGVLVVSGALVLVTLKESYGVGLTETEDDMLCKALLPFINDQKQCPEYEGLKAYFPSTKKNIMSSLLNMVKRFAKESSLTCWLFCMPLLHYMYERYKPYQVPSTKINHSDSDAIWWGINGLTIEIGYFKAKSQWDRKRNETLQELAPYFSFDYLLPRTFMACLSFYHVLETIDLQPLPMDAILATLYYHIKTTITFPKDYLRIVLFAALGIAVT